MKNPQLNFEKNKNDTLCWYCKNCTSENNCSWVNGIPVKGWKATQTKLKNVKDEKSYNVSYCPNFVLTSRFNVTITQLSQIIGIARHRVAFLLSKNIRKLKKAIKEKGYLLEIININLDEEKTTSKMLILKRQD